MKAKMTRRAEMLRIGMVGCSLMAMAAVAPACSGNRASARQESEQATADSVAQRATFNADSAMCYLRAQTAFGPRVPNTEAHRRCAAWLRAELRRHGAEVLTQPMTLTAFDGTRLQAVNIMGSYNPSATDRLLLMAHWDTRPWADEDADTARHSQAPDGANDGASGVAVLLEVARQLAAARPSRGIDILFADAEDWGSHSDDASWALGARYFVEHPIRDGYRPAQVILLDMVGSPATRFHREYHSQQSAPQLMDSIWNTAAASGFADWFVNAPGGAVTDDHVQFIRAGIPAIDIIGFNPDTGSGFAPTWHTSADNVSNISPEPMRAVGQTLLNHLLR